MFNRFSYCTIFGALILLQCMSALKAEPASEAVTAEHHMQFYPVSHEQYDAFLRSGGVQNVPSGGQQGTFIPFMAQPGMMPTPGMVPAPGIMPAPGMMPAPGVMPAPAMMMPPAHFNYSQDASMESLFRQKHWGEAISESLEWVMKNVGYGAGLQAEGFPLCVVQFPEVPDLNLPNKDEKETEDVPMDKVDGRMNDGNMAKKNSQPVVVCVIIMRDGSHRPMNQLSEVGASYVFNRKESNSKYQKVPKHRPNKNKTPKRKNITKRRKSNRRPSYSNYDLYDDEYYRSANEASSKPSYQYSYPTRRRRLGNRRRQVPIARRATNAEAGSGRQYGIYPSPYGPYGGAGANGGYNGPFVNPYGYPQHPYDSGEEDEDDEGSHEDYGENSEENSGEEERALGR